MPNSNVNIKCCKVLPPNTKSADRANISVNDVLNDLEKVWANACEVLI